MTSPKDPTKSTGTYNICEDCFAADFPNNPVWWLDGDEFRYIFNTGSKDGWRIGNEDGLKSGKYFYKSKTFKIHLNALKLILYMIFLHFQSRLRQLCGHNIDFMTTIFSSSFDDISMNNINEST